jgi:hypothetical protein
VTRRTIRKRGVEFVEESITDPQTGNVEDTCERSPSIPRDIGAWVRSITRSREDLARARRITEAARRALLMIRELHGLGYQRLRLVPGLSPSGCYWRAAITPACNIRPDHGALLKDHKEDQVACHTTGAGLELFGWKDAGQDTPRQLAEKFLARFPGVCALGYGRDEAYAAWYERMLDLTGPDGLPFAYADAEMPTDYIPATNGARVPLPPAPAPDTPRAERRPWWKFCG